MAADLYGGECRDGVVIILWPVLRLDSPRPEGVAVVLVYGQPRAGARPRLLLHLVVNKQLLSLNCLVLNLVSTNSS